MLKLHPHSFNNNHFFKSKNRFFLFKSEINFYYEHVQKRDFKLDLRLLKIRNRVGTEKSTKLVVFI